MYKRRVYRRHNIEKRLNFYLSLILVVVALPMFITTFLGRLKLEDLLIESPKRSEKEEVLTPEMLAKQIGIHMPRETIKAQSVIARTQYMSANENGGNSPVSFTISELQELWGEQFENYYEQMQDIIMETAGETLQYNGAYIYAAYHKCSAGNTRDMKQYYEKSTMPYLSSVNCHEDSTAEGYLTVYFWEAEDFCSLMANAFLKEKIIGVEEIQILKRDEAGYALEVKVGQTVFEGEEFRKKINLPSACFEITQIDGGVRIVSMGQGHGFGLSQHMAGKLAERGMDYQEILKYFYKGVAITN